MTTSTFVFLISQTDFEDIIEDVFSLTDPDDLGHVFGICTQWSMCAGAEGTSLSSQGSGDNLGDDKWIDFDTSMPEKTVDALVDFLKEVKSRGQKRQRQDTFEAPPQLAPASKKNKVAQIK